MKQSLTISIATALFLALAFLILSNRNQTETPTETPTTTEQTAVEVEQWPEVSHDQFDDSLYHGFEDRYIDTPPQLASSLQAEPTWNPTQTVPGMYRVNDGLIELNSKKVTPYTVLMNTGYGIMIGNPFYQSHHCEKENCIPLSRDNIMEYNEFIILDYEGNLLHKYRLEEGYTLVDMYDESGFREAVGIGIAYNNYEKSEIKIQLRDKDAVLNEGAPKEGNPTYRYRLDILTGEISSY